MTQPATEIEVEVVEIDGVAPAAPQTRSDAPPRRHSNGPAWQQWQGRVRQLDRRWWPLWVFLGIIAAVLLLTVGVVFGIIFLIFRFLTQLIRAILG